MTIPLSTADAALEASPVLTGAQETTATAQEPDLPGPTLLPSAMGSMSNGVLNLEWQWEQELEEGQDYELLRWARDHSQKRLFPNQMRRGRDTFMAKYADPARYVRKMCRIMGADKPRGSHGSLSGGTPVHEATKVSQTNREGAI